MARVKGAMMTRKRRKKTLKLAKGYWGGKSRLYRTANEAVMKSLSYAFVGRKAYKSVISVRSVDNAYIRRGETKRHELLDIHKRAQKGRDHAQPQNARGACR
jgi:hypothetical protein